jgi:hypothetical protein
MVKTGFRKGNVSFASNWISRTPKKNKAEINLSEKLKI